MHDHPLRAGSAAALLTLPAAGAAFRLGLFPVDLARSVGTVITADERRALRLGTLNNVVNAIGMAWGYRAALRLLGWRPSAARGALLGAAHGALSLVTLAMLARVHPRRERARLPEPGHLVRDGSFYAVGLTGHVVYGAILGTLLR
jgi:hypothetical protein